MRKVLEIDLLGRQEMQHCLPHSERWSERWSGATESLIAAKTS